MNRYTHKTLVLIAKGILSRSADFKRASDIRGIDPEAFFKKAADLAMATDDLPDVSLRRIGAKLSVEGFDVVMSRLNHFYAYSAKARTYGRYVGYARELIPAPAFFDTLLFVVLNAGFEVDRRSEAFKRYCSPLERRRAFRRRGSRFRFLPVTRIGAYWTGAALKPPSKNLALLGHACHAITDASTRPHLFMTLGHGHMDYEDAADELLQTGAFATDKDIRRKTLDFMRRTAAKTGGDWEELIARAGRYVVRRMAWRDMHWNGDRDELHRLLNHQAAFVAGYIRAVFMDGIDKKRIKNREKML